MTIREKNEQALSKLWKKDYNAYLHMREYHPQYCEVTEAYNKEKILSYLRNERRWRLNSIYSPMEASEKYAARYSRINEYEVLCFFGMSDGRSVKRIIEGCKDTNSILIYEPSIDIFFQAMENFDLSEIFRKKQLHLVVKGINDKNLGKILEEVITYENREIVKDCILPNYDILFLEEGKNYIETILYYIKLTVFVKNTEVKYAMRLGDNLLQNLPYLLKDSSITNLKTAFCGMNLEDTPAIIVSAGPSLDKNIKALKQAEGIAFIIGVDSALKALVREGIQFQIAVSVDPRKNPAVFEDERVNHWPIMLSGYSLPLIAQKNTSRMFFEGGYGFEAFQAIIKELTGKKLESVKTGGSVATDAFSLALDLGFRNIIMVGQDLAFTGGRGHVSGFEKSEQADKEHVANRELTEVEALGGGSIQTDIQMASYKQWFEQQIAENKNQITVYNATEGGARIKGTIELPLTEAITKCCKASIDFDRVLAEVPKMFTQEEVLLITKHFLDAVGHLEELTKALERGIVAYNQLIALEQEKKQNTAEYRQTLEEIYRVNGIEEKENFMALIKLYSKENEYEAADGIYKEAEMTVEEIAQRGKQMLQGYVEGIHMCRNHMEELLVPELKKIIKEETF